MHLTTSLTSIFAALAYALPTTESPDLGPSTSEHAPLVPSHHSPSTLDLQHPSDSPIFTVQAFQAWVTSSPAEGKPNWASFYVSTSDSQSYTCSFVTVQPVLSATVAWECEGAGGGPKDKMWFKFSPGFNEMELQRSKESKGNYMTEYATQGTYWNVGPGGNATVTTSDGMRYKRDQSWDFEVTRISG